MNKLAFAFFFLILILASGCVSRDTGMGDSAGGNQTEDSYMKTPQKFLATRDSAFRAGKNADVTVPKPVNEVSLSSPVHLQNSDVMEIEDTRYVLRNSIVLGDGSFLVVRNSVLEFGNEFAYQWNLSADGNARVLLENSSIISSYPMNFEFRGNSSLTMINVRKDSADSTFPWMTFGGGAKAFVYNSKFDGTLWDSAEVTVDKSPSVYVEIVFPAGSAADEMFDVNLPDFSFPNENEVGIGYRLRIRDSTARGWGFTVRPQSNITIRGAHNVVMTLVADEPWKNETVHLSGLKEKYYDDATWMFGDTSLRFVDVDAWQWSPLAYGDNSVFVSDSHLADIAWGGGHGKIIINNSDAFFLRAREEMEIVAENSRIHTDVIAIDNSRITLKNTTIGGKIVEEGSGRVTVE